jgi:hypothetical protein
MPTERPDLHTPPCPASIHPREHRTNASLRQRQTEAPAMMFALAVGKAAIGAALDNPVLRAEGRVTLADGMLAVAALAGLALNAGLGAWPADPPDGYVLICDAAREVRNIFAAGLRGQEYLRRRSVTVVASDRPPSRRVAAPVTAVIGSCRYR